MHQLHFMFWICPLLLLGLFPNVAIAKSRIALLFVSRDKVAVLYKGLHIFETVHPRKDSCWFVGKVKNDREKDTLLSIADGCAEESDGK